MRILFITIILITINYISYSQKANEVSVVILNKIETSASLRTFKISLLIPNNIENRQIVDSISIFPQPDSIFCIGENRYATLSFTNEIPNEIMVVAHMRLLDNGYIVASKREKSTISPSVGENYVKPSLYIDSHHPEIVKLAEKLKKKNQVSTIKNIYNYVNQNIKYSTYLPRPQGSLKTLQIKSGDCTDFAHLMIALCRANGIPSRNTYGLVTKFKNMPKHDWVEVLIDNIGWVTFDPTVGNSATSTMIENKYIVLSSEDPDPVLGNGYYYRYNYTSKEASTTVKVSQTFITKNKTSIYHSTH